MATFKGSDGVVKAGASASENAIGEIRNFSIFDFACDASSIPSK